MKDLCAAITMVKDDHFYLKTWVDYYGGMFGRQALYVVSHGDNPRIAEIAEGCNVMRIPPGYGPDFNSRRWEMLSQISAGLQPYYRFVICGDVDEFVVLDPAAGRTLPEFLERRRDGQVITPIGLEVVHRSAEEPGDIASGILRQRRHARYSSLYSKPCILGAPVKLARGGHYASHPRLKTFARLYLFHMKYCDRQLSITTLRKRMAQARATVDDSGTPNRSLRTRWKMEEGEELALLDRLEALPRRNDFDFGPRLAQMSESWGPRDAELYHFRKDVGTELHVIPERFADMV